MATSTIYKKERKNGRKKGEQKERKERKRDGYT